MFLGDDVFENCQALESVQIPRHFEGSNITLSCPPETTIVYYDASTLRTPIPVSYDWLDAYPALLSFNGNDYEATALSPAANGINRVWECYLAGLDPTNPDSVFVGALQMVRGEPTLSWSQNLGTARHYIVEGKTDLSCDKWSRDLGKGARFFRIVVEPPKPHTVFSIILHIGDI